MSHVWIRFMIDVLCSRNLPFCSSSWVDNISFSWIIPFGKLVAQPCPTLCDPVNCSLLSSSVCGILQARVLEWAAIPFLYSYNCAYICSHTKQDMFPFIRAFTLENLQLQKFSSPFEMYIFSQPLVSFTTQGYLS